MASKPRTFLFGDSQIATATSGRAKYGHTFGGPHDRKGTSRGECKGILMHLLHRFDLTDPAIPIAVPGVHWLPFYYCFDFRANSLGYQLISDEKLVTFFPTDDPNVSKKEEWPDDNYPLEFPKSNIKIADYDYDPTKLEEADRWAGIFGIDKLSKRDRSVVKKRIVEHAQLFGGAVPRTEKELREALSNPFMQGKPNNSCLNPNCTNHKKWGKLSVIALMPAEPVKGVHTFGPLGSGVQLIFELCPKCYTVRVGNQCD
jgi:hypothetical protein